MLYDYVSIRELIHKSMLVVLHTFQASKVKTFLQSISKAQVTGNSYAKNQFPFLSSQFSVLHIVVILHSLINDTHTEALV